MTCPSSINLDSNGKTPVAILGSDTFDVSDVDPATVDFEGASPVKWAIEDANGDGYLDLVLKFKTQDITGLFPGDTVAQLTGELTGGQPFQGEGPVNIAQPKP